MFYGKRRENVKTPVIISMSNIERMYEVRNRKYPLMFLIFSLLFFVLALAFTPSA